MAGTRFEPDWYALCSGSLGRGFGKVYAADVMASLPLHARRLPRIAVKRANTAFELHDVQKEIRILQSCSHAHLLPLYGYCLDSAMLCLVRTHTEQEPL